MSQSQPSGQASPSPTLQGSGASKSNGPVASNGPATDNGKRKRGDTPPMVPNTWVMDIILEATTKEVHDDLKAQFMSLEPDMGAATLFFIRLNKIEDANRGHDVDPKQGIIPPDNYERLFEGFVESLNKTTSIEEGWEVYNTIHKAFDEFNKEHHLPAEWNITPGLVERWFGTQIKQEPGNDGLDSLFGGSMSDSIPPPRDDRQEASSDGLKATGLDELEALTREEMRSLSEGKVLFWWKKGTGSQTFVQYGTDDHPIYRIRAGSYELYDPLTVPQILSLQQGDPDSRYERVPQATQPRGKAKLIIEGDDGNLKVTWNFTRQDVAGIIGIGWKIDDDDEESVEPLEFIWPEPYACYPQTRALVKWKDGEVSLEDRAYLRRIIHGSSLQGDKVIYQKALTSEVLYRQEQDLLYEHLMDKLAASKAKSSVAVQEEDDEPEVITVASQTPIPAPRPQRGQSRPSEVRFALPRSTPSRAATPSRSAPPAENPQSLELMYLRESRTTRIIGQGAQSAAKSSSQCSPSLG
ncbi:hypothetical protein BDV59DRAFT_212192 [Aspergillus ambiguus]|uniref:uncharacterized protein n=1 Tax=Aspergillus ambiguus TaxID=176160 RepID=UPI003CCDE9D4